MSYGCSLLFEWSAPGELRSDLATVFRPSLNLPGHTLFRKQVLIDRIKFCALLSQTAVLNALNFFQERLFYCHDCDWQKTSFRQVLFRSRNGVIMAPSSKALSKSSAFRNTFLLGAGSLTEIIFMVASPNVVTPDSISLKSCR